MRRHSADVGKIVDGLEEVKTPAQRSYSAVLVEAPVMEERRKLVAPTRNRQRLPRKLDYAARDEANRKLGRLGEDWVIGYEQHRLTEMGHPELFQSWSGSRTRKVMVLATTFYRLRAMFTIAISR